MPISVSAPESPHDPHAGRRRRASMPPPSRRRGAIVALAGLLSLVLAAAPTAGAFAATQSGLTREYDLKAAFLFNFSQFVEWPGDSLPDPHAPFVIGVLGEDPFGASLDEIVANEKVHERKIVVRRFRRVDEATHCQILFISRSETPRLNDIVGSLDSRSVLTVGDAEGFANRGGRVSFGVARNRLRVTINPAAARAAKLTISSKLLRQATRVNPEP